MTAQGKWDKQTRRDGYIMYSLNRNAAIQGAQKVAKRRREFCKRFLEPTFGLPDIHGNYILSVSVTILTCASLHTMTQCIETEGMQNVPCR